MIPNDHAIFLFKFGEQKWIDKLINGEVSFSSIGSFIEQAKVSKNDIQGDEFEGVFAKLNKNDQRINLMKQKLKEDLEIIEEGDYVYLRRHSSKLIPVYCFYGYTIGNAIEENDIKHEGKQKLRLDFDERLYEGFSRTITVDNLVTYPFRFTQLHMQPWPFIIRIDKSCRLNNLEYEMKRIDYDTLKKKTFFIEPTDFYEELFLKSSKYSYQHEVRIILRNKKLKDIFDRFNLEIPALNLDDYNKVHLKFYIEYYADIKTID